MWKWLYKGYIQCRSTHLSAGFVGYHPGLCQLPKCLTDCFEMMNIKYTIEVPDIPILPANKFWREYIDATWWLSSWLVRVRRFVKWTTITFVSLPLFDRLQKHSRHLISIRCRYSLLIFCVAPSIAVVCPWMCVWQGYLIIFSDSSCFLYNLIHSPQSYVPLDFNVC